MRLHYVKMQKDVYAWEFIGFRNLHGKDYLSFLVTLQVSKKSAYFSWSIGKFNEQDKEKGSANLPKTCAPSKNEKHLLEMFWVSSIRKWGYSNKIKSCLYSL